MANFQNIKVGDLVTRRIDFRLAGKRYWDMDGQVIKVTDDEIWASILVDTFRIMKFDRQTGINVLGKDYGWILPEWVQC